MFGEQFILYCAVHYVFRSIVALHDFRLKLCSVKCLVQCLVNSVLCSFHSVECSLPQVQVGRSGHSHISDLSTGAVQCTLYCTLYSVHCTVYSVQYSVHYTVQCTPLTSPALDNLLASEQEVMVLPGEGQGVK